MRIKVTDPIKDYEGNDVTEKKPSKPGEGPIDQKIIYREVFATALNNSAPGDPPMLPEQKSKSFTITNKLYASNEVDLTVDEAALLKEQVGKLYPPLIYGRVCQLLDGDTKEK